MTEVFNDRHKYYEELQEVNKLNKNSYLHIQRNLSKPILEVLVPLKGKKILEIGAGGGHLSNYIKKKNSVISIDISNIALNTGRNNYPDLDLIQMDAENLGFVNNYFDQVISVELIEHLPNLQGHIKEVRRVLKEDGFYLFKTPNKLPHDLYWRWLLRKDVSKQHPSVCDIGFLKRLLTGNGFSVQFYRQDRLTEGQIDKLGKVLPSQKILNNILIFSNILLDHVPINFMPSIICSAKKLRKI